MPENNLIQISHDSLRRKEIYQNGLFIECFAWLKNYVDELSGVAVAYLLKMLNTVIMGRIYYLGALKNSRVFEKVDLMEVFHE